MKLTKLIIRTPTFSKRYTFENLIAQLYLKLFFQFFEEGNDFAIGEFLIVQPTRKSHKYLSQSVSYGISNLYFVIPRYSEKYPSIKKIMKPFTNGIYCFVLGIFIVVFAIYHFLQKHVSLIFVKRLKYNLVVSSLGSPLEHLPKKTFFRFLAASWLILFLILRASYCSFLYHFIRSDMKIVQPDDIQSVLANYKILSTDDMYNLFDHIPEIQSKLIAEDVSKVQIFENAFTSNLGPTAFLMNIELCGFARKQSRWVVTHMYLVPEEVLARNYVIYMKKNSLLKRSFDNKILRYICVGLMVKWEREYMDVNELNEFEEEIRLQKITFEDVSGIFVIWGGLLGLSFIVFIFELVNFKFNNNFKCKKSPRKRMAFIERKEFLK